MPESFILFFWLIFPFFLVETASGMYEGGVAADVAAASCRTHLSLTHLSFKPQQDRTMAFTPSKDQKRREREQKKLDKRLAKEEARAEKLAIQQAAEDAAFEEAEKEAAEMTEAEIQAKLEADFEAELAAEAAEKAKAEGAEDSER